MILGINDQWSETDVGDYIRVVWDERKELSKTFQRILSAFPNWFHLFLASRCHPYKCMHKVEK